MDVYDIAARYLIGLLCRPDSSFVITGTFLLWKSVVCLVMPGQSH